MSYESTAINSVKLFVETNNSILLCWQKAVKIEFPNSEASQKKCCPKNAFLGLCESGKVKDIPAGEYTRSDLNKQYALTAIKILTANKSKSFTPSELWLAVLSKLDADIKKRHNSQMYVVLALWENGLIEL